MSLFESSIMSSFILYCSVRSTTAPGWASDSRRKSDTSKPPLRARGFRTYRLELRGLSDDKGV